MPLYLSQYIGSGTHQDPFRPEGFEIPGSSQIDLREDCTRPGLCVQWIPDGISVSRRSEKIAERKGERFAQSSQGLLKGRWNLEFEKDILIEDAIERLLLRPAKGHWRGLRPNRRGHIEAWLNGERWVSLIQPSGGAQALDDFNRANGAVGSDWTVVSSTFDILNNQLRNTGSNEQYMYWNADTFADDQFSQIQIINAAGTPGLTVRGDGTATDYYGLQEFPANTAEIFKYVSGSYTSLATASYAFTANDYIRLTVEGTTLTAYGDSSNPPTTQLVQVTDGARSTGVVGVYSFFSTVNTFDNWSGGDLFNIITGTGSLLSGLASVEGEGAVTGEGTASDGDSRFFDLEIEPITYRK